MGDVKPVFGVEYCDATEQENGITQVCYQLPARHMFWTVPQVRVITCLQDERLLLYGPSAAPKLGSVPPVQDPGCFCPGVVAAGFEWLIKTTNLDEPRVSCQQYCTMFDCPGRKGRDNCNAGESSVCEMAFKASSVPIATAAMPPAMVPAMSPALAPEVGPAPQPADAPQPALQPADALQPAPQPAPQPPQLTLQPAPQPAEAPKLALQLAPQPAQDGTAGGVAADAPGPAASPAPQPQAALVSCARSLRTASVLALCVALLAWG